MRILLPAALAIAFAAGCGPVPPPAVGEQAEVQGRIASIDLEPMTMDGDGLIAMRDDSYGDIVVHVPARGAVLCAAKGLDAIFQLQAGDGIRVRGEVTGARALTVCSRESHFLERLD